MGQRDGDTSTDTDVATEVDQPGDETGFDDGFENPTTPTATPEPEAEDKPAAEAPKQPTLEERLAAAEAVVQSLQTSLDKSFGKIGGIERTLGKADVDIDQADIDAMRADGFESHARALEKIRDLKVVRAGGVITDDDRAEILTTVKRQLQAMGFKVGNKVRGNGEVLPREPEYPGIQAARAFLPRCRIDKVKCARGLEAMRWVHYEWDDKRKMFKDTPKHDWSSHGAAAFRYLAVGYRPPTERGPRPDVARSEY